MAINFNAGPPRQPVARPVDPLQIFQGRPALQNQINDVWRGQATALTSWFESKNNDILISLNTGAGKSVVGTLICQSWLNSGVLNPVYLCATNDLVEQTGNEAAKLALNFTKRIAGKYDNNLFETGKGFLITSYQTLINARTVLRGDLAPKGIVFDDAHVGEPTIRSQYTLNINKNDHDDIYNPLIKIIYESLSTSNRQKLRFVLEGRGDEIFLCPPAMGAKIGELLSQLHLSFKIEGRAEIIFPYLLLATRFHACAVVISKLGIEISPPFLPSRTIPVLRDADVKRVYLSATLKAESEFVRAYGRKPGLVIEPEVDAGNGERTIISSTSLKDSANLVNWAYQKSRATKLLIATPSRSKADLWQAIAAAPKPSEFAERLGDFKNAPQGGFILSGRFDGIDLPDATCRLMIISGLPTGGSLLENYLWSALEMRNLLSARVATRVTQLFGRIIRGRNDFGVFVLHDKALTNWLERDRNLALLPDLLQKQIKLGQVLQDDFKLNDTTILDDFYEQVVRREPGWLEYYRNYIDGQKLDERDRDLCLQSEEVQCASALLEMKFAEAIWQSRFGVAISDLEPQIDQIATIDAKLAGWLNLWIGATLEMDGRAHLAHSHYRTAKSRLRLDIELPIDPEDNLIGAIDYGSSSLTALSALSQVSSRTFLREKEKVSERVAHAAGPTSTPSGSEEAYRALGAFCGLVSSRPDAETGSGPDVLWIDSVTKEAISFELKTGKVENPELSKKDVGQSHNHIQWISDNEPDVRLIRHFIVGTELTVSRFGNPNHDWGLSDPHEAVSFAMSFIGEVDRLRNLKPDQRPDALEKLSNDGTWSLEAIANRLCTKKITE